MHYLLFLFFSFFMTSASFTVLPKDEGKTIVPAVVSVNRHNLGYFPLFTKEGNNVTLSPQYDDPHEKPFNPSKERKTFIGALFVVLVIVTIALIPKGILFYSLWRKSHLKQESGNKKEITTPHEPKVDIYFEEMRELAMKNDPLFLKRFTEAYSDFIRRLLQKHPQLLKSELSLCAMIFLNFSSKEIAEYTFIQHRSVQTNRSRLRKKMHLSSNTDLYKYIKSFA